MFDEPNFDECGAASEESLATAREVAQFIASQVVMPLNVGACERFIEMIDRYAEVLRARRRVDE